MGVKQHLKKAPLLHHPQSGRLRMDVASLTGDADPAAQ